MSYDTHCITKPYFVVRQRSETMFQSKMIPTTWCKGLMLSLLSANHFNMLLGAPATWVQPSFPAINSACREQQGFPHAHAADAIPLWWVYQKLVNPCVASNPGKARTHCLNPYHKGLFQCFNPIRTKGTLKCLTCHCLTTFHLYNIGCVRILGTHKVIESLNLGCVCLFADLSQEDDGKKWVCCWATKKLCDSNHALKSTSYL